MLEHLYEKIDKHADLVQAYLEIKNLSAVMKMCRLKPHKYLSSNNTKLELCRWWIDEFGNSLEIKYTTLKITYNDLRLEKDKIISTDLYHGFLVNKIVNLSKLVFIFCAKDDGNDIFIMSFLGMDNFLRTYQFLGKEWEPISPLVLGIHNLLLIAENINLNYSRSFQTEENNYIYQIPGTIWLIYLPTNDILLNELKTNYDDTFLFLKGN